MSFFLKNRQMAIEWSAIINDHDEKIVLYPGSRNKLSEPKKFNKCSTSEWDGFSTEKICIIYDIYLM